MDDNVVPAIWSSTSTTIIGGGKSLLLTGRLGDPLARYELQVRS